MQRSLQFGINVFDSHWHSAIWIKVATFKRSSWDFQKIVNRDANIRSLVKPPLPLATCAGLIGSAHQEFVEELLESTYELEIKLGYVIKWFAVRIEPD